MIHRALSSIPARPVLLIAPLLIVVVLAVYYWNLNRECSAQTELRDTFTGAVESAAAAGGILRLADVFDFQWDHVKGLEKFKPKFLRRDCPFGWDWSKKERQAIIDADLLSVLIFFHEGKISSVVDFRNDRVAMEEFESGLPPETAVFKVDRTNEGEGRYILSVERH